MQGHALIYYLKCATINSQINKNLQVEKRGKMIMTYPPKSGRYMQYREMLFEKGFAEAKQKKGHFPLLRYQRERRKGKSRI